MPSWAYSLAASLVYTTTFAIVKWGKNSGELGFYTCPTFSTSKNAFRLITTLALRTSIYCIMSLLYSMVPLIAVLAGLSKVQGAGLRLSKPSVHNQRLLKVSIGTACIFVVRLYLVAHG